MKAKRILWKSTLCKNLQVHQAWKDMLPEHFPPISPMNRQSDNCIRCGVICQFSFSCFLNLKHFNFPCSLPFYTLGPVTEVKTDIYVTSFGPVSDVEMVRVSWIRWFCRFWGGGKNFSHKEWMTNSNAFVHCCQSCKVGKISSSLIFRLLLDAAALNLVLPCMLNLDRCKNTHTPQNVISADSLLLCKGSFGKAKSWEEWGEETTWHRIIYTNHEIRCLSAINMYMKQTIHVQGSGFNNFGWFLWCIEEIRW